MAQAKGMSDDAILDAIFDPEMPQLPGAQPPKDNTATADQEQDPVSEAELELRQLETEAAKLAEGGQLDEALQKFELVLAKDPKRASAYNNRAQLYQMKHDTEAAWKDLDMAINHCPLPREVASQAYAQRGVLNRVRGNDDAARADFEKAAGFGNQWARRMAVKLNPYAALCNQMLTQAMKELRGEAPASACTPAQNQSQ
ncbi:uncharacterized protein MONBRDRAFT_20636 [Monosiga brevicollis MX1]|uniref:Tetratricopeptide repeat protein 36 n=1 Tax=Monosiga brevicollis TaxID=81824 RepID=A9UWQ9_MONBE|nr:uncharacterized protein MONBRDRAFT_20636 [Monosiga brevicollis MX1]EDQ90086.1 predicted protein [Monosiga brevicollis MX1]|eukprot:XP_001744853.1 hypothetical protein [Monosiga brevicollis MX1]